MLPPPNGVGKTSGSLGIVSTWLADGYPAAINAPPYKEGAAAKELGGLQSPTARL